MKKSEHILFEQVKLQAGLGESYGMAKGKAIGWLRGKLKDGLGESYRLE